MSLSSRSAVVLAAGGLVAFTALTVTLLMMGVEPTLIGPLILAIVIGVNHLLQSVGTATAKEMPQFPEADAQARSALAKAQVEEASSTGGALGLPETAEVDKDYDDSNEKHSER